MRNDSLQVVATNDFDGVCDKTRIFVGAVVLPVDGVGQGRCAHGGCYPRRPSTAL